MQTMPDFTAGYMHHELEDSSPASGATNFHHVPILEIHRWHSLIRPRFAQHK